MCMSRSLEKIFLPPLDYSDERNNPPKIKKKNKRRLCPPYIYIYIYGYMVVCVCACLLFATLDWLAKHLIILK